MSLYLVSFRQCNCLQASGVTNVALRRCVLLRVSRLVKMARSDFVLGLSTQLG
jgi:hypothetical protein